MFYDDIKTMKLLGEAIEYASAVHSGQVDRAGVPYILHLLRVMNNVIGPTAKMVAILHDTLEDGELVAEDLRWNGFPDEVVDAVVALTRHNGESRMDAAKRAKANKIAREVKIADVVDNMNLVRLPKITQRDLERRVEYAEVLGYLVSNKD